MIKETHLQAKLHQVTSDSIIFKTSGIESEVANTKLKNNLNELVYIKLESYNAYKSNAENRMFHALINKYWEYHVQHKRQILNFSSFLNRVPDSWEELKLDLKIKYNPSCKILIESRDDVLKMNDIKGKFYEVSKKEYYFIKSWAMFTVKQASTCINGLIDEMLEIGIDVDSEKAMLIKINEKPSPQEELPLF